MKRLFLCFLFIQLSLFSLRVETFYGPLEVDEPILIELIESPSFQRLKEIHQYGVSYYTTHKEPYTRYEHSLGVFAVLRLKGASLEEQIAGLLHDVSHTVFSHVGDWMFGKAGEEKDYQNEIHEVFLERYGIGDILRKYQILPKDILPLEELFPMLEQKSPNLCADRIDYNIQGAYYQGFITKEEGIELLDNLVFRNGVWISSRPDQMVKIARFSLFMTEDCWGSPVNHITSSWLASAMLKAIQNQELYSEDIHFGTDDKIWDILIKSSDPQIQEWMHKILNASSYYEIGKEGTFVVSKFRGIDPWVVDQGRLLRLTQSCPSYGKEYAESRQRVSTGFCLKGR